MRGMVALAAAVLAVSSLTVAAERFRFGVLGDTPYFDFEEPMLTRMIDEMDQRTLTFVVHVGDIKSGSDRCDRVLYENRAAWFGQSRHPFVVLPGDNDWTDCNRASNGNYDPLGRLELFRRTFHDGAFGARLAPLEVTRQSSQAEFSEYAENLRWAIGEVMFVALHVVGSRNNFEQPAEFHRRQHANETWLRESFQWARERSARAAVVMMHANTMLEMAATDPRRKGYVAITSTLFEAAQTFDRPVLLIHGDTHRYRFDQPLRARSLPGTLRQISRLEVHGSPTPAWTEVIVDTGQPEVFSVADRQ